MVALLGANGAGKSTAMRAVTGLLRPVAGAIVLDDERVEQLPAHRIAARGVALVPEGRQVFPELSVLDNILLGALRAAAMSIARRRSKRCSSAFRACASACRAAPGCSPAASSRCSRSRAA